MTVEPRQRQRLSPNGDDWPSCLENDPDPPRQLNVDGCLAHIEGPTVAIVGTRRCTAYGRAIAAEFAAALSKAGISVVSGLARGIDTQAHRSALDAGGAMPIAVVGSGLDVVYPAQNAALWREVAHGGAVVSEYHDARPAAPWQFPQRNRIIAAFADVVLVVESHERGGALSTVNEALRRGRTVMAVPGSVRSPASRGTNRLIADGAEPALEVGDIIVALGLAMPTQPSLLTTDVLDDELRLLLEALGIDGAAIDDVLVRLGGSFGWRQSQLQRLEDLGRVANVDGWWTPLG